MLNKLHATHLESDGMKRLHHKKFWWPGCSKDIESKYKSCLECKEDSISKVHKTEVIPEDLTMLAPGEQI